MRFYVRRNLLTITLMSVLLLAGADAACAQEEQPRLVNITTYYFIVEKSEALRTLNYAEMNASNFREILNRFVRERKAQILSSRTGAVKVGDTFRAQASDGPDQSEEIEIATGEYGDGQRKVALSIIARKVFGIERLKGNIPSIKHFDVGSVELPHSIVVDNNSTAIFGGQQPPFEIASKMKGKNKDYLIFFAVEILSK